MIKDARPGQPITADAVNALNNKAQSQILPQVIGVTDFHGNFAQTRVGTDNFTQPHLTILVDHVERFSGYYSGEPGQLGSGLYDATYNELNASGFNQPLAVRVSSLYENMTMREICDNPTAKQASVVAFFLGGNGIYPQYGYKATASVAPVKILSGENGQYQASWKTHSSDNYYFQDIDGITDDESGNITVGNLAEFERDYDETDYSVMASGLSGDLSGGFHTWAQRIADDWFINIRPVPNTSGLEVFNIATGKQEVKAAEDEFQVWMAISGDENNYQYKWEYPRLCDI